MVWDGGDGFDDGGSGGLWVVGVERKRKKSLGVELEPFLLWKLAFPDVT